MTITPRNSSDATAFPDETASHKVPVGLDGRPFYYVRSYVASSS